jgi:integrase
MTAPENAASQRVAERAGFTREGLLHVSKPRKRKVKPWTVDEARRFLESAKRDRDPLYAAYVLILVLGLRKGEIVGLPWSAVNLDGAELDVGWRLQRIRRELSTGRPRPKHRMPRCLCLASASLPCGCVKRIKPRLVTRLVPPG